MSVSSLTRRAEMMRNTVGVGDGGGGSSSQLLRRWWRAMPLMMFRARVSPHFGLWVGFTTHLLASLCSWCAARPCCCRSDRWCCVFRYRGERLAVDVGRSWCRTHGGGCARGYYDHRIDGKNGRRGRRERRCYLVRRRAFARRIIGCLVGHKLRQWMPCFSTRFQSVTAAVVSRYSVVGEGTIVLRTKKESGVEGKSE